MRSARSERVVDAREDSDAFAADADVDVADDERARDAPHAETTDVMQVRQRIGAGTMKYPPRVHERRQLHIDGRRGGRQPRDGTAQLEVEHERIAIGEAPAAVAAQ